MDRFPSMLISLILHLTAFVIILFWPAQAQDKPKLGGLIVQGYVTLGKDGAPAVKSQEEENKGIEEALPSDIIEASEQSSQVPHKDEEHTTLPTEPLMQEKDIFEAPKDSVPQGIEEPSSQVTPSVPPELPLQEIPPLQEVPPLQELTPQDAPQNVSPLQEPAASEDLPLEQKEKELSKEAPPKEPTQEEVLKKELSTPPIEVKEEVPPLDEKKIEPEKDLLPEQKETPTEEVKKETTKAPDKDLAKDKKVAEPAPLAKNATTEALPKRLQEPQVASKVEETPKKEKAPKNVEKKSDPIKEALQDIAKKTPKQQPPSEPSSSLFDVLDDIKKETRGNSKGSGTGGEGGTGIGAVTQAYAEVVGNTIKRNWAMASRADREELHATVRIFLSKSGTIEKYTMVTPSGDKLFDSSLINAIASTPSIPEAPPTSKEQVIDINFYP